MKKLLAAAAVLAGMALAVTLAVRAQEPVIPYAPPRPATTLVMLPDGSTVHVELATTQIQMDYGLMERTNLAQGRGMLFVHQDVGDHPYWMYHCKIALDIVWMDADHRIVEMSPNTPPCRGKAATCPNYGGHQPSKYVIELPAGSIAQHHLQVGQTINFNLSH
ncbi:MAG: DUF192 domain-containing protein [Acidobacteriaceae bacterium]